MGTTLSATSATPGLARLSDNQSRQPAVTQFIPTTLKPIPESNRLIRTSQDFDRVSFPNRYAEVFQDCGYNLKQFPIVKLQRDTDPNHIGLKQATSPVMIFKDGRGRAGFALKVRSKTDGKVFTLIVHQNHEENPNYYVMTDNSRKAYHEKNQHAGERVWCSECSEPGLDPSFLEGLLKNEDIYFELAGILPTKVPAPSNGSLNKIVGAVATAAIAAVGAYFLVL